MSEYILTNNLEIGMHFNSVHEVLKYIGYKEKYHPTVAKGKLTHYCEFRMNENKSIDILNVFSNVKRFRYMWYHEIGEIIETWSGKYQIVDRYIKRYIELGKERTRRIYVCKCLNHNLEFELSATQIDSGTGCPYCSHRLVAPGESIYDLRPDLIKYFKNPDDAKKYRECSNQHVDCKCPVCGSVKNIYVQTLTKHDFICDYCSDGISYPNKFIREMLRQLKIDFVPEHSFEWSNGRIYDQYIYDLDMIIENHGSQHYDNHFYRDDIGIDKEKREYAVSNGINNYIELDCRFSTLEHIKKSVLSSDLPLLLNFTEKDIDWNKCEYVAQKSLVKEVWDFWNTTNDYYQTLDHFDLSLTTLRDYVEKGFKIGYCSKRFYLTNSISKNPHYDSDKYNTRPVYYIDEDIYFFSAKEASEYLSTDNNEYIRSSISRAAKNNMAYKNKHFKYITKEQFNEIKDKAKTDPSIKVFGDYFNIKEEVS